jgi:hypothetical protein
LIIDYSEESPVQIFGRDGGGNLEKGELVTVSRGMTGEVDLLRKSL